MAVRDDGDLVHGIGILAVGSHQRVADFVIGHLALFLLAQPPALALRAGHHLVHGVLQVLLADLGRMMPGGEQGGLIDDVGQVGAREAGRLLGDPAQFHFGRQRLVAHVQLEDGQPAFQVRGVHDDLAVETAWPEQGAIQHLGPVGGRQDDDADIGLEAVHPDQQLIEGLLALVIHRPHVNAALPAHGVQFVNEHDARRLGLGLLEQVAHPRGAHPDEHLHKVAAADQEERHLGFAGHGAREQGLAGAGRPDQQDALGDRRSQGLVAVRVLQES